MKTLLVAGFSTRHVVSSARRAGYELYAIDHFCDADLRGMVRACETFEELADLPGKIRKFCDQYPIDAILVTSGAEDLFGFPVPVLGTDPSVAARFLDKEFTQQFLEELGLPVPKREMPGVYPVMLKPWRGSGGWRNIRAESDADIARWVEEFPEEPYLLQHLVSGVPASVCCVSDGRKAKALAVNRQIMREGDQYRYGFSGSETPYRTAQAAEMKRLAELVVAASGCIGIVGVDFMVSEQEIFVIEINPRFVATLDTIERSTGLNLVQLHIDACHGILPDVVPEAGKTAIRRILFAESDICISTDLSALIPRVADVPVVPALFETGGAIVSIYGEGPDADSARAMLDETRARVESLIRSG